MIAADSRVPRSVADDEHGIVFRAVVDAGSAAGRAVMQVPAPKVSEAVKVNTVVQSDYHDCTRLSLTLSRIWGKLLLNILT